MLEILSQTKEPTAVQPHLKKVFENVQEIEFDKEKKIHAMFSAEKERVNFVKVLDPNKKNVEDWMGEVLTYYLFNYILIIVNKFFSLNK